MTFTFWKMFINVSIYGDGSKNYKVINVTD
jgi:hypothetical protein